MQRCVVVMLFEVRSLFFVFTALCFLQAESFLILFFVIATLRKVAWCAVQVKCDVVQGEGAITNSNIVLVDLFNSRIHAYGAHEKQLVNLHDIGFFCDFLVFFVLRRS